MGADRGDPARVAIGEAAFIVFLKN
eukprot:SAG11_NODE_23786_length_383_cov_0.718310_1_plen_24_part_10